ncbi:hypothetical protein HDF16_001975 [Granulicella aggregans]|uniref:Uncharacterized protein n=1 Tax=Granulicella aggregans TaxID=474949 RepID=A0A7W8E4M1_9BACT|nr:hypothetical protein [Granulicella aggregans]
MTRRWQWLLPWLSIGESDKIHPYVDYGPAKGLVNASATIVPIAQAVIGIREDSLRRLPLDPLLVNYRFHGHRWQ